MAKNGSKVGIFFIFGSEILWIFLSSGRFKHQPQLLGNQVKLDGSGQMPSVGAVTAMTVSPAEETVAIATSSNQLLTSLGCPSLGFNR